jgi:hypothetical protein
MAGVLSGFQVVKCGGVNTLKYNSLAVGWTGMTEAGAASGSSSLASTLTQAGDDRLRAGCNKYLASEMFREELIPVGLVNVGETLREAAVREAFEEAGFLV